MRKSWLISLGISLASLVSPALAADRQLMPGSMCRIDGEQVDDAFLTTVFDNGNGVLNHTLSTRSVVCPLYRDSMGVLAYASVTVRGDVSCELRTFSPFGNASFRPDSEHEFEVDGVTFKRLSFFDGGARMEQTDTGYVFRCRMPAGTSIIHLHADED